MGLDPSAWCGFCIGAVLHQSIKSVVAAGDSRAFLPNDGFTVAALALANPAGNDCVSSPQ